MKAELDERVSLRRELRKLRDEIRLRLHLGSMELKDAWAKLEPEIRDAERAFDEITAASQEAAHDLVHRARELRDALKRRRV